MTNFKVDISLNARNVNLTVSLEEMSGDRQSQKDPSSGDHICTKCQGNLSCSC